MSTVEFTPENKKRFDGIVAKYERPASALLPVLWLAQEQFGYLTRPVIEYCADMLKLPRAQAYEVTSFYFMFRRKDMGKWCLQVCNNVTCSMMGSEELIKVAHEELGIKLGEVSEDKQFSLVPVQCLGSCDTAPVVQVNEDYVENLDKEKFRELIRKMKNESRSATREVVT